MFHSTRPCLYLLLVVLAALHGSSLAFSSVSVPTRISSRGMKNHLVPSGRLFNPKGNLSAATVAAETAKGRQRRGDLGRIASAMVKFGMYAYIASMCVALPVTLFPVEALHRLGFISRIQRERWSLGMGQACASWLLKFIPFYKLTVSTSLQQEEPKPSVWVCNHQSMLDVFIMLAADKKMRGRKKRPIKIVYWKGLEGNPITKLLFQQSGFISVNMVPNKPGQDNEYDRASFKSLLKSTKQAFAEGFDIGLLPEGQPNPDPANGLLPVFGGAYTLSRMSKRPIQLMALWGTHRLWNPLEEMNETRPRGRHVKVRVYSPPRVFECAQEFVETFTRVVGHFGQTGKDLPQFNKWMDGTEWKKKKRAAQQKEKAKNETVTKDEATTQ